MLGGSCVCECVCCGEGARSAFQGRLIGIKFEEEEQRNAVAALVRRMPCSSGNVRVNASESLGWQYYKNNQ